MPWCFRVLSLCELTWEPLLPSPATSGSLPWGCHCPYMLGALGPGFQVLSVPILQGDILSASGIFITTSPSR